MMTFIKNNFAIGFINSYEFFIDILLSLLNNFEKCLEFYENYDIIHNLAIKT